MPSKRPERGRVKLAAVAVEPVGALDHLSAESRAWVEGVEAGWTVDEHHRRLLVVAAECWDTAQAMRRVLEAEGHVYYVQRLGAYRARPEVQIQHDCELRMMRALRDLGLDDAPVPSGPLALRHGNKRR